MTSPLPDSLQMTKTEETEEGPTFEMECAEAFAATTALKLGLAPEDPMRDPIAILQRFIMAVAVDVYPNRRREGEAQFPSPVRETLPERGQIKTAVEAERKRVLKLAYEHLHEYVETPQSTQFAFERLYDACEETHCLECGVIVEPYTLACDKCLAALPPETEP